MTDVLENAQLQEMYGEPELFIVTTPVEVYYLTSWREDFTSDGDLFEKAPMKRTTITYDARLGVVKTTVNVPVTKAFLSNATNFPIPRTRIQIIKVTVDEPNERYYIFDGYIRNVTFNNGVAQAHCEGMDKLSSIGPKIIYQSGCNWQIFDDDCGLNQTLYKVNANIDQVLDNLTTIISTDFDLYADGYFTQGKAYYQNDWRFITDHVANKIRIHYPFSVTLTIDSGIDVYPGCDGSKTTCDTFGNWSKNCSMPLIPSRNPVIWGFK